MHKAIVYHTISTHKVSLPSNIDITPECFEQHLKWLAKRSERVVPLSRLLTEAVNKSLIAITFDDGYEDNLSVALPLLEKYNLPATIFMVAGFIGKKGYLTGKDLAILAAHPLITIGSHTLWHRHLTDLSFSEARHELIASKQILEETINQPVDFLAYPYGDCNQIIEQISAECGYRAAWSVWNGNNSLHSLWRVPLGTNDNLLRFIAKISSAYFPVKRLLKPP
ncbi:MAG: polysaccharide deacetylase family protein [Pyrinomonadaceae bacterium]|nr:polysaccharide deacetylase family protein [Pyrinomonadaceae bacterium]